MTAPVALFAYRRPQHLQRALDSLAANPLARESALTIFCDGARDEAAKPSVAEVRRIARKASGFASLEVVERERNLGLAASIVDGVRRLTGQHGRAIVVEDDLVLAPRFLEFMNAALERYAAEPRVMQISGYMYPCALRGAPASGFLPSISCWGWATWKRAWDLYDPTLSGWEKISRDPKRRRAFDMEGAYDYSGMLARTTAGKVDSWGVVWYLSVFSRGGLVLFPRESLVTNTGFDNSGTHTDGSNAPSLGDVKLGDPQGPFAFPEVPEIDPRYYDESRDVILRYGRGWRHWLRRLTGR